METIQPYNQSDLLSLDDIARATGKTRTTVMRKAGIESFFAKVAPNPSGKGSPVKLFYSSALALWGVGSQEIQEVARKAVRKKRTDTARRLSVELEKELKELIFSFYMGQSRAEGNMKLSCEHACEFYCQRNGIPERFSSSYELSRYMYKDRIMRWDSFYKGYFHSEDWKTKHDSVYQAPRLNARIAGNRWDIISCLESADLIGKGYGAGDFWVLDATNLDAWVNIPGNDRPKLGKYMSVIDGVTGYPLYCGFIEHENVFTLNWILAQTAQVWGVPKYGVVLDNLTTNRSPGVQNFIRRLYADSHRLESRNWKWFKKAFGGNEFPLIYNLPNIPRFPMKAEIERSFKKHKDEFVATRFPLVYQGGDRKEAVKLTLNNNPYANADKAVEISQADALFQDWLYNDYVKRIRDTKFSIMSGLTGKAPTIENAFDYYGGFDRQGATFDKSAWPYLYYYLNYIGRHKVKAGYNNTIVSHNGTQRNYILEELYEFNGCQVSVIPEAGNERHAYIYAEYDAKKFNDKVPGEGDVYFIGMAYDATMRSFDDMQFAYQNKQIRKNINKKIKGGIGEIRAWDNLFNDNAPAHPAQATLNPGVPEQKQLNGFESMEDFNIKRLPELPDGRLEDDLDLTDL
jgi:hypothetical protein